MDNDPFQDDLEFTLALKGVMSFYTVLFQTPVTVTLISALFLAGCGGGSGSNSTPSVVAGTPNAAPAPNPAPNPDPNPAPAPTPPPTVILIVSPAAVNLLPAATLAFSAGINGVTATDVTWRMLENNAGNVTAAGIYTAPATSGTYHVRATSKADGTKFADAVISVSPPASANPVWVMGYYVGYHASLQTPAQVHYAA